MIWVENLRAISTIAVVMLHLSGQITWLFGNVLMKYWWIAFSYNSITRFAVPVFVLMTGFLTLGKEYQILSFYKKRLLRILIPFIFWSVVYIAYDLNFALKQIDNNQNSFIINFIIDKFSSGAYYHMWYLYMLIGIYLIHPIINKWVINSSKDERFCFLIICLLFFIVKYTHTGFLNILNLIITYTSLSEWIALIFLGYILFKSNINIKNYYYLLCFIVFSIIICYVTYYYSKVNNGLVEKIYPWGFIQGISILLFFKTTSFLNVRYRMLSVISNYSLGIYLIHPLILVLLGRVNITCLLFDPIFSIPVITFITIIISLIILFLIDKIPFGKYIIK